jgi:hypothetical protein
VKLSWANCEVHDFFNKQIKIAENFTRVAIGSDAANLSDRFAAVDSCLWGVYTHIHDGSQANFRLAIDGVCNPTRLKAISNSQLQMRRLSEETAACNTQLNGVILVRLNALHADTSFALYDVESQLLDQLTDDSEDQLESDDSQ